MMQIIKLSKNQISEIYLNYLKKDFHAAEVKSFFHILNLFEQGSYVCYGLCEENKNQALLAYAFFCTSDMSPWLFLDYFAVCSSNRGQGYGSAFFEIFKDIVTNKEGILAEVENPDYCEKEEEKKVCQKRIEFYKKNHWLLSPVYTNVFGVEYQMIQLPFQNKLDSGTLSQEVALFYHTMFSDEIYAKNVRIKA